MTKRHWLKMTSIAVMLSTSLLMFAEGGQAFAARANGNDIVSQATVLLGKPYQINGTGPASFDSAGFVTYVLSQNGINVDDTLSALNHGGKSVPLAEVHPGDVLLFKTSSGSLHYAGIYIGEDKFLYASKSKGEVIQQKLSNVKGTLASVRHYTEDSYIENPASSSGSDQTDDSKDSYSTAQIVQLAKAQLGKDYKYNTNGPNQFDAAGLVAYVYGQVGLEVKDSVSALYQSGEKVDKSDLEPGDIVFFKNGSNTKPSYCGIYVGDGRFVYAAQWADQVIERKLAYFEKSYAGARRLHEVEIQNPTDEGSVTQTVQSGQTGQGKPSPQPDQDTSDLGAKIIKTGEKYLGVPYKFGADWNDYQGKYFDCSGFTQRVFAENGIKLNRGARGQFKNGVEVSRKDLKVGDLVFFSTGATMKYAADSINRIGHVGIYAGNNRVLHTYGKGGVRYSKMDKGWWNDHYVTAVRVIQ